MIACIALCAGLSGWADVTLVQDGKPNADIVLPKQPLSSVKLAAEDLQKHLELMSGAKLPIVETPSANMKNHVYVGESDFTKKLGVSTGDLKVEGFKIVVKDNAVILVGCDEQREPFPFKRKGEGLKKWRDYVGEDYFVPGVGPGIPNEKLEFHVNDATATLYAVSEFLEQLGVRWYAPYENGTVVPKMKTIVAKDQNIKKEPAFPFRTYTYYNWMRRDGDGILWFKRLKYGASYSYYCGHSTIDIIYPPEQKLAHPEYYAMSNGKRVPGRGGRGVPRLTNPSFRKSSLNYLEKTFDAYPSLTAMSVGMPDGFTAIDERDAKIWNQPGRGYHGKFSDYVWDYWLHMAKELKKSRPDKDLACIAYTTFLEPPTQIEKLPENVTLHMCYQIQTMFLPQGKAAKRLRNQWLDMLTSKKLYVFNHYRQYTAGRPRYPVVFTKLLQQDMKELNGVCEGKFVEIAPNVSGPDKGRLACVGLTHLLHYLQGKLYWDPNLDLAKLLNEYYELYFGPAKAEMKEFYEFAEEVWTRPETRSVTVVGGFLKPEDVDRYFDILARARAKAGKGTVYDQRIAQIESEMRPLKDFFKNMKRTGPDFHVAVANQPVTLDGDLDKPFWQGDDWIPMKDLVSGEDVAKDRSTQVSFRLTRDKSALVVGVKCYEPDMEKIITKATDRDDFDIFNGDIIEIYIETPERSYFKICVDPNGNVWDESQDVSIVERDTLPTLWNPGVEAAVKKGKNLWTAEVLIPTKDFGALGPDEKNPWGINVCRARWAEKGIPCYAISPTGRRRFAELSKLGNLRID